MVYTFLNNDKNSEISNGSMDLFFTPVKRGSYATQAREVLKYRMASLPSRRRNT